MILLFSLLSPIAELFPNMYLSWWLPSNGDIDKYLKARRFRIIAVLIVWIPILFVLGKVTTLPIQLSISALVIIAFGLRLYLFDRKLQQLKERESEYIEPSKIPEIIYFIAFTSIGFILYFAISNMQWLVPTGIFLIFLGANRMGTFRRGTKKKLNLDVVGRIIFTIGFLINLYNLARASAIV